MRNTYQVEVLSCVASVLKEQIRTRLSEVTEFADREASMILLEICGLSTLDVLCGTEVTKQQIQQIEETLRRRFAREPLQYILGYSYFRNLKIQVNSSVLIPRPETELMVDWLIEEVGNQLETKNQLRLLEIGVGSGAITAALLEELPDARVRVDAVDISPSAVEIAKKNIRDSRAEVFCSDLFVSTEGTYDIIYSNPPYIPLSDKMGMQPEVKDYEPALALFAGDGYDIYKRILSQIKQRLRVEGAFIFEIGHNQFECMKRLVAEYTGRGDAEAVLDYSGRRRFICLTNCNS